MYALELQLAKTVAPEQVMEFRAAFLEASESGINGSRGLHNYEDYLEWLQLVEACEQPDNQLIGVQTSTYLAVRKSDGQVVGCIELRHTLNDALRMLGGHIGYSVKPSERGKGYATQMLQLMLQEAARLGLDKVLLTCDVDNVPSIRTIERCGGVKEQQEPFVYEGELYYKYWIENNKLPPAIRECIGDKPYTLNEVGMSDSQVICFEDMVLKLERQREESDNEYRMMQWLEDKLPVPKVLAFERQDGYNYLLMSRMEGEMSCNEQLMQNPQLLVQLLAAGLKQLWQVDITDCPYHNTTENKLRLARERVAAGRCSMENVEPDTYGENGFANPEALLRWLQEHRPQEDLVFSHGDYCMPNIFIQDGQVSGFIDLGRSGVADKYQDIALCYRSLKHNYAGEYGGKVYEDFRPECLFEALGIEPDWEKIRYYNLMDELF